ncbi:helix-turn-helix domain-containing protein [Lysinibacillus xylanilyticus]|uniref:helix-turn-helix domain-containing protein n=1 Tax=Lysinibacillus xylanilyticus TaxID=582475 RepID=UPI002B24E1F8|nr:helix-turn-helix domain-containing protein [Lysinibacillus xylanilyticus]MEB2301546.1 helix-turn-helix domain-containing protein [Lysinibacillus xylanilyticus]
MQEELIALVEKSKHDDTALLTVLNYFEPRLKHCLYQTHPHYREDLRQDLLIKLINTIKKYDVDSVPGFWDMKNLYSDQQNKKKIN